MINSYDKGLMEQLCRCCMRESTEARSLFEIKNAIGDQSLLIADMFMACASVEIAKNDSLPKIICAQCELKLSVAFEFKQQCEKTDSSLRKLISPSADEVLDIKPDVNDYYDDGNTLESNESDSSKSDKDSFCCKFCAKEFRSKNGFRLHMQKHKNEKLHNCHICHKKFSKGYLHKHLQSAHKIEAGCDTYTCEECDLSFPKSYLLSRHMREHRSQICVKDESREDDNIDVSEYLKDECPDIEVQDDETKGKHECKYCNKVLTTFVGLKIHMRRHTGNNLHSCGVCNKTFTKSNHLKCHLLTHGVTVEVKKSERNDRDKKIMQCEFCDRQFKYKKSFSHHMHTEHGISDDSDSPLSSVALKVDDGKVEEDECTTQNETDSHDTSDARNNVSANIDLIPDNEFLIMTRPTRTYTCHVCQANFVRVNHLTRHMTFHKAVLIHKCDRCDKAFATPEYLEKHTQEDHIDKPYTCTICDKTYTRGEHLIRHLKTHLNPKEMDHKCSICDKEFSRSDHLARHIKLHLQQDKRHVCKECGKAFNRLDNLKTHQKIHTGQKDHSKLHLCIYCGKEFNNSSNMIVHMRRHTGERPYKCSICNKGFPRSHDLKCHERTHSGEKPYMCTLCGKAFNKSNKLLRHTRVHTGERPYACNLCNRAFTQSNDLALHMRRHTGARPYACGVCPARFIQSGQLKAHRRSTGHWMETQPDLKGGHRVEPVVPLSEPAPIKFKTHGKKKLEDELNEIEAKESQSVYKPVNIILPPLVLEETKLMNPYQSSDMLAYNPNRENVEETSDRIKSEVQNNCASNNIISDKEQMEQHDDVNTFQIYGTEAPTSTSYTYPTFQSDQSFG